METMITENAAMAIEAAAKSGIDKRVLAVFGAGVAVGYFTPKIAKKIKAKRQEAKAKKEAAKKEAVVETKNEETNE